MPRAARAPPSPFPSEVSSTASSSPSARRKEPLELGLGGVSGWVPLGSTSSQAIPLSGADGRETPSQELCLNSRREVEWGLAPHPRLSLGSPLSSSRRLMQMRQASAACGWAWGLPRVSVPLFPGRVERGPALPFLFPGISVGSYIFISKFYSLNFCGKTWV